MIKWFIGKISRFFESRRTRLYNYKVTRYVNYNSDETFKVKFKYLLGVWIIERERDEYFELVHREFKTIEKAEEYITNEIKRSVYFMGEHLNYSEDISPNYRGVASDAFLKYLEDTNKV